MDRYILILVLIYFIFSVLSMNDCTLLSKNIELAGNIRIILNLIINWRAQLQWVSPKSGNSWLAFN
jgi:hypothetical protein